MESPVGLASLPCLNFLASSMQCGGMYPNGAGSVMLTRGR
ncbi:hypothetical protein GGQ85_004034 [Nitrobacter vulgaris]|nr:hypothetical protein [Nitrobacter vulgaris]